MLLKPVQMASGIQFYRRPDGKLVKLVPVSQLRAVTPTSPAQTGESADLGDGWGISEIKLKS